MCAPLLHFNSPFPLQQSASAEPEGGGGEEKSLALLPSCPSTSPVRLSNELPRC